MSIRMCPVRDVVKWTIKKIDIGEEERERDRYRTLYTVDGDSPLLADGETVKDSSIRRAVRISTAEGWCIVSGNANGKLNFLEHVKVKLG